MPDARIIPFPVQPRLRRRQRLTVVVGAGITSADFESVSSDLFVLVSLLALVVVAAASIPTFGFLLQGPPGILAMLQ